jgi:methionyl-tRNA formyltransferase
MTSLRIVFAGSPNAAVPSLQRLARSEHEIAAVITRDDSPQGRKRVLTPTPVAETAEALGLPVIKANRLNAEVTAQIEAIAPDLGVIVAYGGLVREPLLSAPRLGWVNLHFSLLPRWRGAAPVQRAIIAGDELTGAAVFQLVEELDAGPVYGTMTQSIGRHQTAGHLLDSLADSGAELLAGVVDALGGGSARGEEQAGEVTVAPKLSLDDGRLDFTEPAAVVYNRLRGVTPEPGAFAELEGTRLKIIEAGIAHDAMPIQPGLLELVGRRVLIGTADRPLELVRVHPAGKKPMDAADWWRGRQATR